MATFVGTTPGGTTPAGMTSAGTTPESEVRSLCPVPATPERPTSPAGRGCSLGGAPCPSWVLGPEWVRRPGGAGSQGVKGAPQATDPRSPCPVDRRPSVPPDNLNFFLSNH